MSSLLTNKIVAAASGCKEEANDNDDDVGDENNDVRSSYSGMRMTSFYKKTCETGRTGFFLYYYSPGFALLVIAACLSVSLLPSFPPVTTDPSPHNKPDDHDLNPDHLLQRVRTLFSYHSSRTIFIHCAFDKHPLAKSACLSCCFTCISLLFFLSITSYRLLNWCTCFSSYTRMNT